MLLQLKAPAALEDTLLKGDPDSWENLAGQQLSIHFWAALVLMKSYFIEGSS